MKVTILTNNRMVVDEYSDKYRVEFIESQELLEVMKAVRDKVHNGHKLLTHPLSGSIKPNETPFKSIVLKSESGSVDFEGLKIIEESIFAAEKFIKGRRTPRWTSKVLQDFRLIDYTIIRSALDSMKGKFIG